MILKSQITAVSILLEHVYLQYYITCSERTCKKKETRRFGSHSIAEPPDSSRTREYSYLGNGILGSTAVRLCVDKFKAILVSYTAAAK